MTTDTATTVPRPAQEALDAQRPALQAAVDAALDERRTHYGAYTKAQLLVAATEAGVKANRGDLHTMLVERLAQHEVHGLPAAVELRALTAAASEEATVMRRAERASVDQVDADFREAMAKELARLPGYGAAHLAGLAFDWTVDRTVAALWESVAKVAASKSPAEALQAVRAHAVDKVTEGARWPRRSTSQTSNLEAQAELQGYGRWLAEAEWML